MYQTFGDSDLNCITKHREFAIASKRLIKFKNGISCDASVINI